MTYDLGKYNIYYYNYQNLTQHCLTAILGEDWSPGTSQPQTGPGLDKSTEEDIAAPMLYSGNRQWIDKMAFIQLHKVKIALTGLLNHRTNFH